MAACTANSGDGEARECGRCHKTLSDGRVFAKVKEMVPEFFYLVKLFVVLVLCLLWAHINQLGQLSSRYADKWAHNIEAQLREPQFKDERKRKPKKWFKAFLNSYVRMWTKLNSFYGPILGKYAKDQVAIL